jgi:hypothetical protein
MNSEVGYQTGAKRTVCGNSRMPDTKYYRKQAQLFARLAVTASDPVIAARYNAMALDHLARAEWIELSNPIESLARSADGRSPSRRHG